MGGTRFVGKSLVPKLLSGNHELTIFTRGNLPVPDSIEHVLGDRNKIESLELLKDRGFDIVFDLSGRNLDQSKNLINVIGIPKFRFVYISSAGVYADTDLFPIDENYKLDQNSRHIGKADTERWLIESNISFTSFRPTYIFGPGNYNSIESWFFDRLINRKTIPIPGDGNIITQLGHVSDLTDAMILSIKSNKANNQIYNCSGSQAVTFNGIVNIAAEACGVDINDVNIKYFEYSKLDTKARKAFPLRISNFITNTLLLENDLEWKAKYDVYQGFIDSFQNDYLLRSKFDLDFSLDQKLLNL